MEAHESRGRHRSAEDRIPRPGMSWSSTINLPLVKFELLQALASEKAGSVLWIHALQRLQAICRRSLRLPKACYLQNESATDIIDRVHPVAHTASSSVFQGHRHGRMMAYKSMRTVIGENEDAVRKVRRMAVLAFPVFMCAKGYFDEIIAWRWLRHPNILPFVGASRLLPLCGVSEWMANGDVLRFVQMHQGRNRLSLVSNFLLRC
jgi:hypothetical protein